jgi:hypothetical protein
MRAKRGEALKFLKTAITHKDDACLLWPYNRNSMGRGMIGGGGGGAVRTAQVHVLVCIAVNGPKPTSLHEVSHICHNGKNGCVSGKHLKWATQKENFAAQNGQRYWAQKLTARQVLKIRDMLDTGLWPQKEIAQQFHVSEPTISSIRAGERWGWLATTDDANTITGDQS